VGGKDETWRPGETECDEEGKRVEKSMGGRWEGEVVAGEFKCREAVGVRGLASVWRKTKSASLQRIRSKKGPPNGEELKARVPQ